MLYTNDLFKLIFENFDKNNDELIIISGWLGGVQVEEILKSGLKIKALYGMCSNSGVPGPNHDHLKHLDLSNKNLEVYYALPGKGIHSKIYIWKSKGKIKKALIGSANFTYAGLYSPNRESLITINPSDFESLEKYVDIVLNPTKIERCTNPHLITKISSIYKARNFNAKDLIIKGKMGKVETIRMSFLDKNGKLPEKSGINWGHGNAHTKPNDAYIKISTAAIKTGFFKPKSYERLEEVALQKAKKYRINLDVIWDDGTAMVLLDEGNQIVNGILYAKNLSSAFKKDILGAYLRKRLNVASGKKVTIEDLKKYGRTYIDITATGPDSYYMDFSPIKK